MALRATPTIAICLTAGVAAGIALARPDDQPDPNASAPAPAAEPASGASADTQPADDSPYLVDATVPSSDSGQDAPVPAEPVAISIEGFTFTATDAVAGGSPIAVTNLDSADHTLTATDGAFDTGTLGQNESVSIAAPTSPGTYEFFCAIHPSMTGRLVVS